MPNHSLTTLTKDYYITQLKRMTTCRNAQTTAIQTVTTVDSQKATYTYLRNVQEYKKYGRTIKPYLQSWLEKPLPRNKIYSL